MADTHKCPRCSGDEKMRIRSFSDQATAALVVWGELNQKLLGQPLCDSCYVELRDILIERADELARGELLAPTEASLTETIATKKEKAAPATAAPAKKKAATKKAG